MTDTPATAQAAAGQDRYADHTPVMRQYLTLCDEHPGVVVLYRLGDFYEVFGETAVKLNRLLGLTLTHRGVYRGEPIPMAGLPEPMLEQYIARLVRQGESVAICEQIGDPKAPRTGAMERRIVRIVTPGTVTDNAMLAEKSDPVLLAVTQEKGRGGAAGLVWLTLTNGAFRACQPGKDMLGTDLARVCPSEILAPEDAAPAVEEALALAGAPVTRLPSWHFDADRGLEQLRHRFGAGAPEAWGVAGMPGVLAAANAILGYVEQTQCEALPYIESLKVESESSYLVLDAAARRNLEVSQSLHDAGGPTLFSTLDACCSAMGSRQLNFRLNHPVRDAAGARASHEAVAELIARHGELEGELTGVLRSIADIERFAGRIGLRSIRPPEAAALRDTLPRLEALAALVSALEAPYFAELRQALAVDPRLHARLSELLLDEPSPRIADGDVIRSSASAELAELRDLRDNAGRVLV
ncbi:MAG: DNA mismatch repair protein MutS, partial [Duodenibacillus sp.]|nr:DNA mismatch repair protein MutS [Duodenibacillus sp.]